jgi:hypothetical protein
MSLPLGRWSGCLGWPDRRYIPSGEFEKRVEPQSWPFSMKVVPTVDELDPVIG